MLGGLGIGSKGDEGGGRVGQRIMRLYLFF